MIIPIFEFSASLFLAFLLGCALIGVVRWNRGRHVTTREERVQNDKHHFELADLKKDLDNLRNENTDLHNACARMSDQLRSPQVSAPVIAGSAEDSEKLKLKMRNLATSHAEDQASWEAEKQTLEKTIQSLQSRNAAGDTDVNSEGAAELTVLKTENARLHETLVLLKNERESLLAATDSAQQRLRTKTESADKLEKELTEMRSQLSVHEKKDRSAIHADTKDSTDHLRREIIAMRIELSALRTANAPQRDAEQKNKAYRAKGRVPI